MPITAEEAWAATDPSQPDEARQASAQAIMAGVAANDSYIASRGELEQLVLQSRGGQVANHADLNSSDSDAVGASPTGSALPTADVDGETVEDSSDGHAVLTSGESGPTDDETLAKLRKQLEDAGITPEV